MPRQARPGLRRKPRNVFLRDDEQQKIAEAAGIFLLTPAEYIRTVVLEAAERALRKRALGGFVRGVAEQTRRLGAVPVVLKPSRHTAE